MLQMIAPQDFGDIRHTIGAPGGLLLALHSIHAEGANGIGFAHDGWAFTESPDAENKIKTAIFAHLNAGAIFVVNQKPDYSG